MRLDKYFSLLGIRSRSEIKADIKKGYVKVNGQVEKKAELQIDENKDVVEYKDEVVSFSSNVYYLLNKPAGYVTARSDDLNKTVMELVNDNRKDLSPVGRLDKDTEGLLIITNDGDFNHRIMSPKNHISKTYFARVLGEMTEEDVEIFANGVDIGDEKTCLPAELKIIKKYPYTESKVEFELENKACVENIKKEKDNIITEIELTITEGRYHQVKRMVAAVGKKVICLKRVAIGNIRLEKSLELGKYKKLTKEEIEECIKGTSE